MIGIENKIVDPKVMPVVVVRRKERLQSALDAATESPNVVSTGYGPLMSILYYKNHNQNPNRYSLIMFEKGIYILGIKNAINYMLLRSNQTFTWSYD